MDKINIDPYATTIIRSESSIIWHDEDENLLFQHAKQAEPLIDHSDRSYVLNQFHRLIQHWKVKYQGLLGDTRWNHDSFLILAPFNLSYLANIPEDYYIQEEQKVLDCEANYNCLYELSPAILTRISALQHFAQKELGFIGVDSSTDNSRVDTILLQEFKLRIELFAILNLIDKYLVQMEAHSSKLENNAQSLLKYEFNRLADWMLLIKSVIGHYYSLSNSELIQIPREEQILADERPPSPPAPGIDWSFFPRSKRAYDREFQAVNSMDLLAGAKAVFQDYVNGTKGFNWFLHCNRHHAKRVAEILADSSIDTIAELLDKMKAIPMNPEGSLARRIAYIEEKMNTSPEAGYSQSI